MNWLMRVLIHAVARVVTPVATLLAYFLRLARGALLLGVVFAHPVFAQTCPTEDPAIDTAKGEKLFLYFPAADDATFPNYATGTSPAKAFDATGLTSAATTANLIDGIRKVVVDDYCEFNVQVQATTTNPATLAAPPPRRVTVAVGADNNGGGAWGQAQEVDIGDTIDIDFARVWAGAYLACEGGSGPNGTGCSNTGSLTGANDTLEHWAQAIGGTAAHEAGHTYGLSHSDDDPQTDPCSSEPGDHAPILGDDPFNKLLMPSGCNLTGPDRADFRRHFGDWTYGILATNVGLSVETMHNWDMVNPNAAQAASLAIDFLSPLATAPAIAWTYTGSTSPWISPVVTGPSGTATFKGKTYNKYRITWSTPNPIWNNPSPGVLAGGAGFHVGTTFTGVDFRTTDPIIIQNVTLFDATPAALPLSPRLPSYNAGTLDAAGDTFTVNFTPPANAPQLRLVNATVFQLPRVATIDSLVGDGTPFDRAGRPIQPWSSTLCGGVVVQDGGGAQGTVNGVDCTIATVAQSPHVLVSHHLGEPGVIDCSAGVPQQPPPPVVRDSIFNPDFEGPICAGTQHDPFPSTTIYVVATFEDPNALHFDPQAGTFVVGPVQSKVFYQFSGVRQVSDLLSAPMCQGKAVIANSGQSFHNAGSLVQGGVQAALSVTRNSGSNISGSISAFLPAGLAPIQPPPNVTNLGNVVINSGQTVTLAAGDYFASSLTLNSRSALKTSGKVRIWAGALVIGGTAAPASNSANDLTIFVNSATDLHVNSGGSLVGTIYAPTSNNTLVDGTVHGCVVGGSVTLNSGGKVVL